MARSSRPAALAGGAPLSNRVGAGLDPCCAMQTRIELKPGEEAEVIFFLGEAGTKEEAQSLISRFRTIDLDEVFRAVNKFWSEHAWDSAGEDTRSFDGHSSQ